MPGTSLTYRGLTVADLPAVFEVRLSTRENGVTLEILEAYGVTPETLAEGLAAGLRGWVCEDEGRIVGFTIGDGEAGEVQVVAVLPSHEGLGIGKALLDRVGTWLFSRGHTKIWLLANPDPNIRASGFYQKLGWRKTGEMRGPDEVLVLSDAW